MQRAKRTGALTALVFLAFAPVAGSVVVQAGGLRISVLSQVIPYRLPRLAPAPIAVFVAGHLSAADGGIPPQLQRLKIEVTRHGLFQSRGLPVCHPGEIQPA